jgi:ribosomal protein L29
MKIKELRGLNKTDLNQKLEELYKELMKENAQVATGTVPKNPGKLKVAKKTIARIKTLLVEKEVKQKA